MVSRRRCDDLSIGDDSTAASLPAGLLMPCSTVLPETSACATQPLRRLANSAAVAIHVSDPCIAVSLPFFSLVILHGDHVSPSEPWPRWPRRANGHHRYDGLFGRSGSIRDLFRQESD